MFCSKCGSKVAEGALFCGSCGAKMINSETAEQASVKVPVQSAELENARKAEQTDSSSTLPAVQEAYNRLMESAAQYPKIKRITIKKSILDVFMLRFYTVFNMYDYVPNMKTGEISLSSGWSWRGYLVMAPILMCDGIFLEFFFQYEHFPVLSILCLIGCLIWFPFSYLFCYKEVKEVVTHINSTLGCEIKLNSKALLLGVTYVFNIVEIILCIVSLFM